MMHAIDIKHHHELMGNITVHANMMQMNQYPELANQALAAMDHIDLDVFDDLTPVTPSAAAVGLILEIDVLDHFIADDEHEARETGPMVDYPHKCLCRLVWEFDKKHTIVDRNGVHHMVDVTIYFRDYQVEDASYCYRHARVVFNPGDVIFY